MALATVSLFLDKRACKEGEGVIKWSVCHQRRQRLFTTGIKVPTDEWEFLQRYKAGLTGHVKDEDRRHLWQRIYGDQYRDTLTGQQHDGYLKRGQNVVGRLADNFTFNAFAEAIANYGRTQEVPVNKLDVIAALRTSATLTEEEERIGTSGLFTSTAQSLQRFVDSLTEEQLSEFMAYVPPKRTKADHAPPVLLFEHLTPRLLTTYEQWMLRYGKVSRSIKPPKPPRGASLTTIGIYLRNVRAVVNEAIEAGLMAREAYPFGRNRYVIPAGTNTKKALPKSNIELIKAHQTIVGTNEQRSHDLWLFSYFGNGMNMTDICNLKWEQVDLKANTLTFARQKSVRTKRQNRREVTVQLRPETKAIIERWASGERAAADYVFPFLTVDMNAKRRKSVVQQVVEITNRWMKKTATSLGIEANVNSYSARHSFATTLLKSKAPLAFISTSLGHTNLKTTESYLGSFDDEEAKEFLNAL